MNDGADDAPAGTDIRPLDEQTVARIAAGEVVERPASVVKELVENALDAGASRIDVAVENGGIDRIEVRDDGVGMTEADLRASVQEHTTSKLDDADDLEMVATLGFRGEALHTVGAVSRMEITSRPNSASADGSDRADPGGDASSGTRLTYVGGDVESVEPAAHPGGTTVAVADLFYNTPARQKYLAAPATEFRHVSRVVGRYALANPDVAVSLSHDGSEVFATTGDGDRLAAVMAVYGREVAESMVHVDESPDTDAVDRVHGYVSHPETNRASREYLATYVNDRAVEADEVRGPIVEAYGGQLAADRYPFAVLFVDVPPARVDVNVHPRKLAVRFDDEPTVRAAIEDAVRDALLDSGLVRTSAPRGVSAAEETSVQPTAQDTIDAADDDATTAPNDDAASAADESSGAPGSQSPSVGDEPSAPDAGSSSSDPGQAAVDSGSASVGPGSASDDPGIPSAESSSPSEESGAQSPDTAPPPVETDSPRVTAQEQSTLDGEAVDLGGEFDRLPPLSVLGQFRETFLVAEDPEGLVLIDQHAADERVHYERLREAVEEGAAQTLADPVEIALTPTEADAYDEYADALAHLGFFADREGRRLEVRSVPTVLGETLPPGAIHDVFEALLSGDGGSGTVESMADELLGDLACAPAVTGNTSLTEGSVADLLAELDACENPFECPHGRPTVIRIDVAELEERFERDYPGHGDRRE